MPEENELVHVRVGQHPHRESECRARASTYTSVGSLARHSSLAALFSMFYALRLARHTAHRHATGPYRHAPGPFLTLPHLFASSFQGCFRFTLKKGKVYNIFVIFIVCVKSENKKEYYAAAKLGVIKNKNTTLPMTVASFSFLQKTKPHPPLFF